MCYGANLSLWLITRVCVSEMMSVENKEGGRSRMCAK